jgi:DNA-binding transcriptional MerR regulator
MPNIQGDYTLSELALKIGVSPSWINKVQNRTGIGGKTGTSGKRVYFTEQDLFIFKNVDLLRRLGFDLKEIKEIYESEKKLIGVIHGTADLESSKDANMFIIHPGAFAVCGSVATPDNIDEDAYKKCSREIFKISKEVAKRADRLGLDFQELKEKLSMNIKMNT